MVQVTLFCAFVNRTRSVSVVDIDTGRSVAHLKETIKENNQVKVKCDASDLQLFLAKKDGAWLRYDDKFKNLIQTNGFLDVMKKMRASWQLMDPSLFGEGASLGDNVIHVLVVVPPAAPSQLDVSGVSVLVTKSMELNDPPLVAFWNACRTISTDIVADSVIALPEKTFILGQQDLGSRIYVRPCYTKLWDTCRNTLDDKPKVYWRLVILGNPGIGKTYFGFFVLFYLARTGATVVYESSESKGKRILLSSDKVVKGSSTDFDDILEQPKTFYVVDGVRPSCYNAKTILITSPRREIWYRFFKKHCDRLCMPVWMKEEIFKCRELVFQSTPLDIVEKRYIKWGGIVRYVLSHAEDSVTQDMLDRAISKADLNAVEYASIESRGVEFDVSQRFLPLRVNRNTFRYEGFDFASKYIAERVFNTLYERNRKDLMDFLARSYIGKYEGRQRMLFERYAHSVLSHGGTFECRRLTKEEEDFASNGDKDEREAEYVVGEHSDDSIDSRVASEFIELPPRTAAFFRRDVEVAGADPTKYLQPASRDSNLVDAMAKPNELFQVIWAHVLPCKQEGIFKALDLLRNPASPRLYFVVPPNAFEDFRYQYFRALEMKKGKVDDEKMQMLEQYVIKMDFAHEICHANESVQKSISQHEEGKESSGQRCTSKRTKFTSV